MNRYVTELARRAAAMRPCGRVVKLRGFTFTEDPDDSARVVRVLTCPACDGEGTVEMMDGYTRDKWGTPEPRWRAVPCGNCHGGVVHGPREYRRAMLEYGDFADEDGAWEPDPYDDWCDKHRDDN